MKQKFIRVKEIGVGVDVFVLFPDKVTHWEISAELGMGKCDLISAGFVRFSKDDLGNTIYECYGRSISLDLESVEDDSRTLNKQMVPGFGL